MISTPTTRAYILAQLTFVKYDDTTPDLAIDRIIRCVTDETLLVVAGILAADDGIGTGREAADKVRAMVGK